MNFSSKLSLSLLASVAISFSGSASYAQTQLPGEGRTVRISQPTGEDTGWILSNIYAQLLEELGYTPLDTLTIDLPVAYAAMATGDVDIYPYGWFPLHNTYLESSYGDAQIVGHVVEQGALQGYLVDRASAEKFGITSLEDFKRDEVKQAFDRDGDGKADLVACPAGWGCELTITYQLDAFDLRDHVNEIRAGYSASMADAIAAYQSGEPIFFYTWTPNWTVNELVPGEDVVWIETPSIELPAEQQELADSAIVSGVEGCVSNPCQLGWPVNDISVVASRAFLEENPAARTLLELAFVDINFIYAQNAAMRAGENSQEDLRRQAAEYIEANREAVDSWIEQAIASAQ